MVRACLSLAQVGGRFGGYLRGGEIIRTRGSGSENGSRSGCGSCSSSRQHRRAKRIILQESEAVCATSYDNKNNNCNNYIKKRHQNRDYFTRTYTAASLNNKSTRESQGHSKSSVQANLSVKLNLWQGVRDRSSFKLNSLSTSRYCPSHSQSCSLIDCRLIQSMSSRHPKKGTIESFFVRAANEGMRGSNHKNTVSKTANIDMNEEKKKSVSPAEAQRCFAIKRKRFNDDIDGGSQDYDEGERERIEEAQKGDAIDANTIVTTGEQHANTYVQNANAIQNQGQQEHDLRMMRKKIEALQRLANHNAATMFHQPNTTTTSNDDSIASLLVEPSWKSALASEMEKEYFLSLSSFVCSEIRNQSRNGPAIYPAPENIFRALNSCPFTFIKVVILGQDPYHQMNQAMGLSFSVPKNQRVPSSLQNIYKELQSDMKLYNDSSNNGIHGSFKIPSHGDLSEWSNQGILLLNTVLTVRDSQANSHKGRGWEKLTDACIRKISKEREGIVFLLWGKQAHNKESMIDTRKHHVLKCAHPSGLSAHRVGRKIQLSVRMS